MWRALSIQSHSPLDQMPSLDIKSSCKSPSPYCLYGCDEFLVSSRWTPLVSNLVDEDASSVCSWLYCERVCVSECVWEILILKSEINLLSCVCICVYSYICVCMGSYIMRLTFDSRLNRPFFRHAYDDETLVTTMCVWCVCVLSSYIRMSFWKWQPHDNSCHHVFLPSWIRKITFWHIRLSLVLAKYIPHFAFFFAIIV